MTFDPGQKPSKPFQPPASSPSGTPSFIPPTIVGPRKASGGRVATGTLVLVLAGFVAAAGIGFAGGRATAPQPTGGGRQFAGNGQGFPNASGAPRNGGFGGIGGGGTEISGAVTAVGNGTITIQIAGGASVTITVPTTATYHGQTAASASDVAVGAQVQVTINRAGGFRGGPDASGAPAASPGAGAGGFTLTATDITLVSK